MGMKLREGSFWNLDGFGYWFLDNCDTLLIKSSMSIQESKRSIKMKMKLKLWISRNVKIKRF